MSGQRIIPLMVGLNDATKGKQGHDPKKVIVFHSGRGAVKLTIEEAERLLYGLRIAIDEVRRRKQSPRFG